MAATCCEQGGSGLIWQDPCTGSCDVEFCFVSNLEWRLQDILNVTLHRSPRARTENLFVLQIQVAQCSTDCHAQFLRLFSLDDDVNDAHRPGSNRPKQTHTQFNTHTHLNTHT